MSGVYKCYVSVYCTITSSVASPAAVPATTAATVPTIIGTTVTAAATVPTTIIGTTVVTTTTIIVTTVVTVSSRERKPGDSTLPGSGTAAGAWQAGKYLRTGRVVTECTLASSPLQWGSAAAPALHGVRCRLPEPGCYGIKNTNQPSAHAGCVSTFACAPGSSESYGLRVASLTKCPGRLNDGLRINTVVPWERPGQESSLNKDL